MTAHSVQFSSVTQSCLTLCDPMNRSTPGLPVHHQLPEITQTHVHWVSDAIQPFSSSVVPFSSCPQSLPASGLFPMSQLFSWGGQSTGVSASAWVLPVNTQDLSPLHYCFSNSSRCFFSSFWFLNICPSFLLILQPLLAIFFISMTSAATYMHADNSQIFGSKTTLNLHIEAFIQHIYLIFFTVSSSLHVQNGTHHRFKPTLLPISFPSQSLIPLPLCPLALCI